MAACAFCQLPYPESDLQMVEGRPLCPQCRVPVLEAKASAAAAPDDGRPPRIILPVGRKKFVTVPAGTSPAGLAAMACTAAAAVAALGAVYAALQFVFGSWVYGLLEGLWARPLSYARGIAPLLAGYAIGWPAGKAGMRAGNRSAWACLAVGAAAGLAAVYWTWALHLGLEGGLPDPRAVWAELGPLAESRPWDHNGVTLAPSGYLIVWSLEALAFVSGSVAGALFGSDLASAPWCEPCRRNLRRERLFRNLTGIPDKTRFTAALRNGDLSPLLELELYAGRPDLFTEVRLWRCPLCESTLCLDLVAADRVAPRRVEREFLLEGLALDPTAYGWVLRRFDGLVDELERRGP
ncbi:MAG: hypothetical protein HY928_04325 [Elusimicrobia bacterium]|nr:hypothetical protein [Elusimicrobiota bacterium]